jgi:hypothetical protein
MAQRTIVERLVYVKSLYNISQRVYAQNSSVSSSMAVVVLDNSIENLFWLIIDEEKPLVPGKLDNDFTKLVNEVENICKMKQLTLDTSSIIQMHKARNNVQHHGILLDKKQSMNFFSVSDKILIEICENIFDISWDSVTLSLLIEDQEIADLYKNAEISFAKCDFRNAANNMIMAFERAKNSRQINQFGSGIAFKQFASGWNEKNMNDDLKQLLDYVDTIYSEVEVIKLGLDYKKWRDYRLALGNLNPDEDFDRPMFDSKSPKIRQTEIPLLDSSADVVV